VPDLNSQTPSLHHSPLITAPTERTNKQQAVMTTPTNLAASILQQFLSTVSIGNVSLNTN